MVLHKQTAVACAVLIAIGGLLWPFGLWMPHARR